MNERIFINMPKFKRAWQRVGKRRQKQQVLVCGWEMIELRAFSADHLRPFAAESTTPSALADVYSGPTGLVRRCRKKSGASFNPSDIEPPSTMSLQELVASILSEPDHPYSAMLALQDRLPVEHPDEPFDWARDPASEWRRRLLLVEDEIFVPTRTPTLSATLDRTGDRLVVAAYSPPATPPSLRLPTIHLDYQTDRPDLEALAADLRVALEFTIPPAVAKPIADAESGQWITGTLADLHHYISRKGARTWPEELEFEVLRRAQQAALYAETISLPPGWLGRFLETPSDQFAHLASYIDALQHLIFARYRILGEALPPLPSDDLIGLDFGD
jgi:hypothetical protein